MPMFFALTRTRTCKHLKLGLNRKRLGKIEHLISDMWIIIFYFMEFIPPPPTPTHPAPSPSLTKSPFKARPKFYSIFFTFKEDNVSLFLVKMLLKPVHTRLNRRPSVFFFFLSFFFNRMRPYTYKGPSQEF